MMNRISLASAMLPIGAVFAVAASAEETPAPAQEVGASGFYLSANFGFTSALGADVTASGANHPTRCDRLLYATPGDAPTDDECTAPLTSARQGAYHFGRNFGMAQALALGYAAGNLRFEVELLMRSQYGEPADFDVGSDKSLTDKDTEWSAITPPNADIYDFRSRQTFVNIAYAFPNQSGWTPWLGFGAGSAWVDFGYYVAFHRKSLDEGYLEVFGGSRFDPDASPEWQRAAAGTLSMTDGQVSGSAFSFQLLGGMERPISTRTVLDLKVRWTTVGAMSATLPWSLVRSHRPVHADGQTPFEWSHDFESLGYLGAGLEMRYRF